MLRLMIEDIQSEIRRVAARTERDLAMIGVFVTAYLVESRLYPFPARPVSCPGELPVASSCTAVS